MIEPAGKKSTVKPGGLARLVFGKGEEEEGESSEEKMRLAGEDSADSGPEESGEVKNAGEDEAIEVDEIKLEIKAEEKVEEVKAGNNGPAVNPENNTAAENASHVESEEQKRAFIQQVFIKPLLSRVFKFIDEKQEMDSKRKTWNLKHKVEQVEDLKR